jgi:hypothetical protein
MINGQQGAQFRSLRNHFNPMPEKRFYPMSCRSLYCGEVSCPANCSSLPELTEFKRWKERTGATIKDPIWGSTCYEAAN